MHRPRVPIPGVIIVDEDEGHSVRRKDESLQTRHGRLVLVSVGRKHGDRLALKPRHDFRKRVSEPLGDDPIVIGCKAGLVEDVLQFRERGSTIVIEVGASPAHCHCVATGPSPGVAGAQSC